MISGNLFQTKMLANANIFSPSLPLLSLSLLNYRKGKMLFLAEESNFYAFEKLENLSSAPHFSLYPQFVHLSKKETHSACPQFWKLACASTNSPSHGIIWAEIYIAPMSQRFESLYLCSLLNLHATVSKIKNIAEEKAVSSHKSVRTNPQLTDFYFFLANDGLAVERLWKDKSLNLPALHLYV